MCRGKKDPARFDVFGLIDETVADLVDPFGADERRRRREQLRAERMKREEGPRQQGECRGSRGD